MSVSRGFVVSGVGVSKVLYNGDSAYDVDVRARAKLYVSGGAYVENATIRTSSIIYICENALASSIVISVGSGYISRGGTLEDAKLHFKSLLIVSSGGTAVDLDVDGGNINLDVYADDNDTMIAGRNESGLFSFSGGVASNFILHSRGVQVVHSGALTSDIAVGKSGYLYVSSGGSALGVKQEDGALIHAAVYGGDNETLIRGSNTLGEFFLSGGTAYNFLITNGGMQNIYSGGVASQTVAGGLRAQVTVYSGGEIHGAAIGMNASLTLYTDTVAAGIDIGEGAYLNVYTGARVYDASVFGDAVFASATAGADEIVSVTSTYTKRMHIGNTGSVVFGADVILAGTVTIDGSLSLRSGITITLDVSDSVNSEELMISDWTKVTGSTFNMHVDVGESISGGVYKLVGSASAFTSSLMLYSGESSLVSIAPGGSVTLGEIEYSLDRDDNDILTLTIGKTIEDLELTSSSAVISSYVTAKRTVVNAGGTLEVSGGMAISTTVNTWGIVTALAGGALNFTTINNWGYVYVSSGGSAENTLINSYGGFYILSGGTAENTVVTRLGIMHVSDGGKADSTTVDGGYLAVSSGGTASGVNVNVSGRVHVSSGAFVDSAAVAADGRLYISSGGTATNILWTPCVGTVSIAEGAEVSFVSDYSGVYYDFENYPSVSGLSVDSGEMYVMKTGFAEETSVFGATMEIWSDGSADTTLVSDDADLYISRGGIAVNTTAENRGEIYVYGAGTAISTTLNDCGYLYVFSGGIVEHSVLNSGGSAFVYSGALASGVIVNESGRLDVDSGGSGLNIDILTGGELGGFGFAEDQHIDEIADGSAFISDNIYIVDSRMFVVSGGVADMLSVNGGFLCISSGGMVTGRLNMSPDATVFACKGSVIDFNISEVSGGDDALVNDISLISGAPEYTLTVTAGQKQGDYRLADGAYDFTGTLTVSTDSGTALGSLSVGSELKSGGSTYKLVQSDGMLSLTVENDGEQDVKRLVDDLNGDGRADVIMSIIRNDDKACSANAGAWLIQDDQTAVWGDLSTLNSGWKIFGTGFASAAETAADVYVMSSDNVIGAWTTGADGKVTGWKTVGSFESDTQVLGLGDFNGDGQSDLLLRNFNGAVGCYFTSGEKTGWNYFQSLGDEWSIAAVGDLNGDGLDDVVLKHAAGFAGTWLTQADGTMAWADLDTLSADFEIIGTGDFNGDGTADVLLKKGNYYGAWLVRNGTATDWFGIGDLGDVVVEQIADFDGDGRDDLRIRTAAGDLGAQLVRRADTLDWKYYGSVGPEWSTSLAAI